MWTRDARGRWRRSGVDAVRDVLSFWGMERGTPEEGGIGPGVDAVGDVLEVLGGWREGRQRKVASVGQGLRRGYY